MTKKLRADQPGYNGYEMSSRYLLNPFGVKEIVTLSQIWWDYYDWLADCGFKNEALVRRCYTRKPQLPVSVALTWLLWHIAWHRQENEIKQPPWLEATPPPPGYEIF